MSLNAAELAEVTGELERLLGARVQKVSAPGPRTAALELRVPGKSVVVLLDGSPGLARVGVVERRPPSPEKPLGLQALLRSQLTGARLDAVDCLVPQRRMELTFSTDRGLRRLGFELGGGAGDLLLLDAQDTVLGGAFERARERGVTAGRRWTPPSESEGPPPQPRLRPAEGAEWPWSQAIDERYGALTRTKHTDALRRQVLSSLRTRLKRAERTLGKVRADRARIEEAGRYRRLGDLLKPVMSRLARGATSARVTEWSETGATDVEVPLLPELSARENVERYYHLHRRLTRSADRVDARLQEVEAEVTALAERIAQAESADVKALETLAPAAPPRTGGPKDQPERVPYREYRSVAGVVIRVGRSARDNDTLTLRLSRGNDLWLHARGVPGSHVLIPGTGAEGPDGETLLDAATLAAHFSGARGEGVVEVAATRRKYVQKPKGSAPGAVRYSQERTIALRLEVERLARLLASEAGDQRGS